MKLKRNNPKLKQRRRELRRNQTDAEKVLWHHLRNRQLNGIKFLRQYSVGPYILDFYSPKHKLAIELDGVHHTKDENQQYDEHRSDYLITHGIKVIRFWNNEVMKNMEGVLLKIAEKIGINLSQEECITPPNLPLNKGRDTN